MNTLLALALLASNPLVDQSVPCVDMLEDNVVINVKEQTSKIHQLIAWKRDSENRLVPVDWAYFAEFDEVNFVGGEHPYLARMKNGRYVRAKMLYGSVTSFDPEQAKRAELKYFVRHSILK